MKPYVAEYIEKMLVEEPPKAVSKDEDMQLKQQRELALPLTDRIKRLVASLPEAERYTPKTMEFFQTRLRGRKGRTAHVGELGEALRKLGYMRKRSWSKQANGFRAYWLLTEI